MIDQHKLARYLSGDPTLSEEEQEAVSDWLREHPSFRRYTEGVAQTYDVIDAQRLLIERISRNSAGTTNALQAVDRTLRPSDGRVKTRLPTRIVIARMAAVLVLVGFFAIFVIYMLDLSGSATHFDTQMREIVTDRGQRSRAQLSDGTQIIVGPDTRVSFTTSLENRTQEVFLEGEAYFSVDGRRVSGFAVHAGGTIVEVVGTEFNIRAYSHEEDTEVAVVEGEVSVRWEQDVPREDVRLIEGEVGKLSRSVPGSMRINQYSNIEEIIGWTEGIMVFVNKSIEDVIDRLERWYDIEIQLADSALAMSRVSGSFGDESAVEALETIALSLGVELQRSGRTFILGSQQPN